MLACLGTAEEMFIKMDYWPALRRILSGGSPCLHPAVMKCTCLPRQKCEYSKPVNGHSVQ